jgi:hypothetical protein
MTTWIIAAVALVLLAVASRLLETYVRTSKRTYPYQRRDNLMTRAERDCYHALVAELGADYIFFPQVHLDAIVAPKVSGKDWLYAFRHINQKSVDFVACDKDQLRPAFAIELDDQSHNLPRRVQRDREVERILDIAGIPLIRVQNHGCFDPHSLAQEIQKHLAQYRVTSPI